MSNKKHGFTLPEVLITMGVIGVLSALLIPTIVAVKPNKNKVMMKKAYYLLEQSLTDVINDDSIYPYNPDGTGVFCYKAVAMTSSGPSTANYDDAQELRGGGLACHGGDNYQVIDDAGEPVCVDGHFFVDCSESGAEPQLGTGTFPTNKLCYEMSRVMNVIGTVPTAEKTSSCTYSNNANPYKKAGVVATPNFTTTDGIQWFFVPMLTITSYNASSSFQNVFTTLDTSTITDNTMRVYVDVNGNAAPNCAATGLKDATECTGTNSLGGGTNTCLKPDRFWFQVHRSGRIVDMDPVSECILKNPTKN